MTHYQDPLPCPICDRLPDVDECAPKLGWYANCYHFTPYEHCFGVNAETKSAVLIAWNEKVRASATPGDK